MNLGESTAYGRLAENVMHFARVLRAAGLPIGPDRVLDAVRALEVAGVERREDFYWTLASVFLGRREQSPTRFTRSRKKPGRTPPNRPRKRRSTRP